MTTLIQSCNQLRTDLQKVKVANQTRQEISALQQRMREWGQHANARRGLIEKTRIVDTTIMQREDIEQADRSVQVLAEQAKQKVCGHDLLMPLKQLTNESAKPLEKSGVSLCKALDILIHPQHLKEECSRLRPMRSYLQNTSNIFLHTKRQYVQTCLLALRLRRS